MGMIDPTPLYEERHKCDFFHPWDCATHLIKRCWSGLGHMFGNPPEAAAVATGFGLTAGLVAEGVHLTAAVATLTEAEEATMVTASAIVSGLALAGVATIACIQG